MRLTKGMKKALSMFLTGALVVTGASIPATQTKAASAEKFTWEGTLKATGIKSENDWAKTTDSETFTSNELCASFDVWAGGSVGVWCGANMTSTLDLSTFEKPVIKVTYDNESDAVIKSGLQFCYELDGKDWKNPTYADAATGTALTVEQDITVGEEKDSQFVAVSPAANKKVIIKKIEIYDAAYTDGTDTPDVPTGKSFKATLQYIEPSWTNPGEDTVEVTKDGEYTLTTWAKEDNPTTINMAWIETDLKNGDVSEDFKMNVKSIQIGTKLFTYSKTDDRYLCFKDQTAVKTDEDTGETTPGTYRLNIKNDYNALYDFADHQTNVKDTTANMLKDAQLATDADIENEIYGVNVGDVIQVKFTVEGLASDKEAKTYAQIKDTKATVEDTVKAGKFGDTEYTLSTVENIANPDASVAPSQTPATSVAPSQTPAASVQPSQKPAASVQPSQKPAASVQPSQKPVVKKTTKNACTKVKAKKAKVTVKKGKKATLKFTVTAKNKKAKTTDKMKVSVKNKKIVTVSKKKLSKGSATVTVKGKKKGSTKVTVKIGKKSAKVTVKVK